MVRGLIQQLQQFEIFMQAQMFAWKRKNVKTGKDEYVQVQGGLRRTPWGYEYIFPEECLEEVLSMLHIEPEEKNRWKIGKVKNKLLRMALGVGDNGDAVEPIPDYTPIPTLRYIELRGIALYPIGIKKDARNILEGYEQEML